MPQAPSKAANLRVRALPFFKVLSSFLVFGFGAFLLWKYRGFIKANVRMDPALVMVDALGIVWTCVFIGLKYQATFWLIGFRLNSSDALAMGATNRFLNQFLPNLGEVALALYMKRAHNVLIMVYGGLFVATWCLSVLINMFLAGIAALVFFKESWLLTVALLLILTLILIPTIPWAAIGIRSLGRYVFRPFGSRLAPLIESMEAIFKHPSIVIWLILLDLGYTCGMTARYWAGFRMAGVDLPWDKSLALVPFANVISMLGITPLGAGLTEYVLGLLGQKMGYSLAQGALAASLDRGVMLVVLVGLGPLSYAWLMLRPAKKKPLDSERGFLIRA